MTCFAGPSSSAGIFAARVPSSIASPIDEAVPSNGPVAAGENDVAAPFPRRVEVLEAEVWQKHTIRSVRERVVGPVMPDLDNQNKESAQHPPPQHVEEAHPLEWRARYGAEKRSQDGRFEGRELREDGGEALGGGEVVVGAGEGWVETWGTEERRGGGSMYADNVAEACWGFAGHAFLGRVSCCVLGLGRRGRGRLASFSLLKLTDC